MRLVLPFRRSLQGRCAADCYLSGFPEDQRVPHRIAVRCLRSASASVRDPALGLKAAQLTDSETFDVLEYVLRSAPSLLAGVQEACRCTRILHDGLTVRVKSGRQRVSITFALQTGLSTSRELSDYALGSALLLLQRASLCPIRPLEAHFRHNAPDDTSPYAELFSCPLVFEAEHDAMVLSVADMKRALPGADAALHALLLRCVPDRLASFSYQRTLTLSVRDLVASELRRKIPSLPATAERLEMSQRSLNRRLSEEGTTYRAIVDGLRRELAFQYLEDTDICMDELASLLGFAHPAALGRAFRRWTGGETPLAFRARQRK